MNSGETELYSAWLSSIDGIGPARYDALLNRFGSAKAVWDCRDKETLTKLLGSKARDRLLECSNDAYLDALKERIDKAGVRVLCSDSDDYPVQLFRGVDAPPPVLYLKGETPLDSDCMFAIVGSRRCTRDGKRAAREFAEILASQNVTVVSGLAYGIDAAAHEGALMGQGKTVAVLGCGADVVYPQDNELLYRRILECGGTIVSEYPPGTQPRAAYFPARNRIISGLSRGVLLVEGARRSGAMITIGCALEQGRDVFAVPGCIYSSLSEAPNRLLTEGATPALSGWDILEHYHWAQRADATQSRPVVKTELSPLDERIVRPLLEQEMSLDELGALLKDVSTKEIIAHLTLLELKNIVVPAPGGLYRAYL